MGHKILLADDSITVQKIVKLTFSDEGIEVIAVGNGELAVQKLQEMRPDLVMADVFMPGKDGYEVCEYVKTHPDLCHTPVILLVHAFEPFDQEHALRVGADQHLTKPFQSIRALVATVKDIFALPASQAAYSAVASSAQTPAPEPSAIPLPAEPSAEPSFAAPQAEPAFTAIETRPAFAATDIETNFPSVDSAPALPTFAPPTFAPVDADSGFASVDAEIGFVSVDTAPLAFPAHTDQDSGEVIGHEMNDAPPPSDLESCLSQLTLESPFTTQPEPPAPLASEINVSVAETAEPLSFDAASALNVNLSAEPAEILPADDEAETAPLACTAEMEELSEVLDLDNEPLSAPLPGDELELLPEITATPYAAPEASAAVEPAVGAQPSYEPTTSAPFTEAPTATGFPVRSDDALPILAEVEMPVDRPLASFQPEAQVSTHAVSTPDDAPLFVGAPEPGAVLESAFTSVSGAFNGHDSGAGQVIAAPPVSTEPQAAKQDTSVGVESAQAPGFNLYDIPPALIDEIARRVVERLSEKAIQEIAWEVVPEMAELLIRQQLAEKIPR